MGVDQPTHKHQSFPRSPAERAVSWVWVPVAAKDQVVTVGFPEEFRKALANVRRADLSADGQVLYVLADAGWECEYRQTR